MYPFVPRSTFRLAAMLNEEPLTPTKFLSSTPALPSRIATPLFTEEEPRMFPEAKKSKKRASVIEDGLAVEDAVIDVN